MMHKLSEPHRWIFIKQQLQSPHTYLPAMSSAVCSLPNVVGQHLQHLTMALSTRVGLPARWDIHGLHFGRCSGLHSFMFYLCTVVGVGAGKRMGGAA